MENIQASKQHFACTDCGQVYTSFFACVCPCCGAGVIRQDKLTEQQRHERVSYAHMHKPTGYHKKAARVNPELIYNEDVSIDVESEYSNSSVIVDHLAFTVKLSDFRYCTKSGMFSGIPFPKEPVFEPMPAKNPQDADDISQYRRKVYTDYLERCVLIFITRVLGFSAGALSGNKFQFYEDSFSLHPVDSNDYLGRVGVGGNNDTIHFQISGDGCKHLFTRRSRKYVHHWLANVLNVTLLTRCDLAFDDFDGIHTCENAERAFLDDGFKRSRGISPKFHNGDRWHLDANGNKVFYCEAREIGSRQSLVYWRIYNKKIQQKIEKEDFVWYRSEVELKKVSVDILLDVEGYYAGINAYASSLFSKDIEAKSINHKAKKRMACDVIRASYWARRQYGRLVNSLFNLHKGDCEKVVGALIRSESKLSFTPMHSQLINSL
ncbi:replication initiation factor domain-containing protein [Vibrio parahaemolyticus]